ncbi:MAG: hypothetical protein LBI70_03170, partial [Rickettsiales bacterium]|nr:hypothetical protein [Rickettsiales bacterium]
CYEYEGPYGEKYCFEPERGSYPEPEEGSKGESSGEGSKRSQAADDSLSYYDEYEGPSGEKYCFEPHEGGSCPEPEGEGPSHISAKEKEGFWIELLKIGNNGLVKYILSEFGWIEFKPYVPVGDTISLCLREIFQVETSSEDDSEGISWESETEKKKASIKKHWLWNSLPKGLVRGIDKALPFNSEVNFFSNFLDFSTGKFIAFSISNVLAYSIEDIFSSIGVYVGPKLEGTLLGNFFTGVSDCFNSFKDTLNGNFIGRALLKGATGFFRTLISQSVGTCILAALPGGSSIVLKDLVLKSLTSACVYSLASLLTDGELSLMEKIKNWKENHWGDGNSGSWSSQDSCYGGGHDGCGGGSEDRW